MLVHCPACAQDLRQVGGTSTCAEGHTYTAVALALATNAQALAALWAAVRALEDDAAALLHLAEREDVADTGSAARRREAAAARAAAAVLRDHAHAAKQRVDALDEHLRAGRRPAP